MPRTFRRQLIMGLVPLAVLLTTTTITAILGLWPAAVMQAAFALTWTARVVVLFRMRDKGAFSDDGSRPPGAVVNLEYLLVLRVQLVVWILAGVYFAVVRFWWGVVLAVFLAYVTLPLARLVRSKARSARP